MRDTTRHLRKFTVSLTEDDAINTLSVWANHERMREALAGRSVFDTAEAAHDRLAEMIERAAQEGTCEPGHECGRCRHWPPQVYEVEINVSTVSRETLTGA